MNRKTYLYWACALAFLGLASAAHADGLADFKAALNKQQGQTAVKGHVDVQVWSSQGDEKGVDESSGQAQLNFEDGAQGLHLHYAPATLARTDAEERAKEKDSKAKTPVLSAMKSLGPNELRGMTTAAQVLARSVEHALFKGEREESWNGKPARRLSFEFGPDRLSEKDRKYIKKFDGRLDVWVAADGTPLASRTKVALSGRAFVVVSFENTQEEEATYALVGDRLVAQRKETRNSGSGMGERGSSRTVKVLQLQS